MIAAELVTIGVVVGVMAGLVGIVAGGIQAAEYLHRRRPAIRPAGRDPQRVHLPTKARMIVLPRQRASAARGQSGSLAPRPEVARD